jgi:gas vesicle protein
MRKYISHILTLSVGLSIGILGGILFAPAGGENLRRSLSFQLKKLGIKVRDLGKDLSWVKNKNIVTSLAKLAGQDLVDRTIQKADKLLEEVKSLAAQLENSQEVE